MFRMDFTKSTINRNCYDSSGNMTDLYNTFETLKFFVSRMIRDTFDG